MTIRSWQFWSIVFACMLAIGTVSLNEMEHVPALLFIAPGYLVQAWLFVRHYALGGLGYQLTMIGVSAAFWTIVALIITRLGRVLLRRLSRDRTA